jgi:hypothetical protein
MRAKRDRTISDALPFGRLRYSEPRGFRYMSEPDANQQCSRLRYSLISTNAPILLLSDC